MAKYKVLVKSFINNTIVEAGAVVEYDGKAGSNLELIKESKTDAKAPGKAPKGAGENADDLV